MQSQGPESLGSLQNVQGSFGETLKVAHGLVDVSPQVLVSGVLNGVSLLLDAFVVVSRGFARSIPDLKERNSKSCSRHLFV